METNQNTQLTKDLALQRLGVHSRKTRNKISSLVDLVHVAPGRQLVTPRAFKPASLAGLTGSVLVTDRENNTTRLDAPFVIGSWACDDRRMAEVRVIALEPVSLVVTNWQERDVVFDKVPQLSRLARTTHDTISVRASETVAIDQAVKPDAVLA